jgi:hypothetical protein
VATGGRRARWANGWEIERLMQLRYDLDSSLGRLHDEYLRCAGQVGPEAAQGYLELATEVESMRASALRRVEIWVSERCKNKQD